MFQRYDDIRSRIAESPVWFDEHGVPRYGPWSPELSANIYANEAALVEIACQDCGKVFLMDCTTTVEVHRRALHEWIAERDVRLGDPPRHNCVGDTMNSIALRIVEFWQREPGAEFKRRPELEIRL